MCVGGYIGKLNCQKGGLCQLSTYRLFFSFLFFFWPGFVILGLDPVNMSPLPDGLMLGSVIR